MLEFTSNQAGKAVPMKLMGFGPRGHAATFIVRKAQTLGLPRTTLGTIAPSGGGCVYKDAGRAVTRVNGHVINGSVLLEKGDVLSYHAGSAPDAKMVLKLVLTDADAPELSWNKIAVGKALPVLSAVLENEKLRLFNYVPEEAQYWFSAEGGTCRFELLQPGISASLDGMEVRDGAELSARALLRAGEVWFYYTGEQLWIGSPFPIALEAKKKGQKVRERPAAKQAGASPMGKPAASPAAKQPDAVPPQSRPELLPPEKTPEAAAIKEEEPEMDFAAAAQAVSAKKPEAQPAEAKAEPADLTASLQKPKLPEAARPEAAAEDSSQDYNFGLSPEAARMLEELIKKTAAFGFKPEEEPLEDAGTPAAAETEEITQAAETIGDTSKAAEAVEGVPQAPETIGDYSKVPETFGSVSPAAKEKSEFETASQPEPAAAYGGTKPEAAPPPAAAASPIWDVFNSAPSAPQGSPVGKMEEMAGPQGSPAGRTEELAAPQGKAGGRTEALAGREEKQPGESKSAGKTSAEIARPGARTVVPKPKIKTTDAFKDAVLTIDIRERNVFRGFRKRSLLKDIKLTVVPGDFVLILGGSGAGKSTLIKAVMGYDRADGTIRYGDLDVYKDYEKVKYEIGYVPQQNLIRLNDTVYHTLESEAHVKMPGDTKSEDYAQQCEWAMSMLGLESERNNMCSSISGGQLKRLSIAIELVGDPGLFFLDEPDSGLDGTMSRNLMENLRAIADLGKIVMVITHGPDRAADLFNKIIVLGKDSGNVGRLLFYGGIGEAREFFEVESLEKIVKRINSKKEGGEGLADEFLAKYQRLMRDRGQM
ncbi:MAG: ATP-binding cassette domain-containing protein [Lachnospiraceae bacterium]|nr:ATP-binding cassette domain-containing protein [Lachnospiraceae bacterium]